MLLMTSIYIVLIISFCIIISTSHILRTDPADFFTIQGECSARSCLTESRGTSEMAHNLVAQDLGTEDAGCICQCVHHLPVFREDLRLCVHDMHECSLVPFVTGNKYQKVPYVYLPLKGQIVYPSAEIIFTGVKQPICVVSGANYLTAGGWVDLRNRSDYEPPFRLYVDEGRTFLQWLGESDLRISMEGRILLVNLLCKEIQDEDNNVSNIFTPCLAFRAAGIPSDASLWSGIREVSFAADNQQQNNKKLDQGYILMAISSVLLGIIYIVAIFTYLRSRQKKCYGNQKRRLTTPTEEHIVKSNPLLVHCQDSLVYLNESSHSAADSDDASVAHDSNTSSQVKVTSALVHGSRDYLQTYEQSSETGNIECLPEENVSIVETLEMRDEKSIQIVGAVSVRRKLYFNPAYFEPELLLAPPPGAIEFLAKIREVMAFAKAKMIAKRFLPSLMAIPEESCLSNTLTSSNWGFGHYSVSSNDGRLEKGCVQSNIRKWLENMPTRNHYQDYIYSSKNSKVYEEKLPNDELQLEIISNLNEEELVKVNARETDVDKLVQSITKHEELVEETTHYEVIEQIEENNFHLFSDYSDLDLIVFKNKKHNQFKHSGQSVLSDPEILTSQDHDYEMIAMNKYNADFNSLPDLTNLNEDNLISDISIKDKHSDCGNLNNSNSIDSKNGYLRITVEDPPTIKEHDSDGIEPDTLDRKPNKFRINDEVIGKCLISEDYYFDSLERPVITLRTSGSFSGTGFSAKRRSLNRAFGSLREIFEAKYKHNQCAHKRTRKSQTPLNKVISKEIGNLDLLMPEARQAKRQRQPHPNLSIKPPCFHNVTEQVPPQVQHVKNVENNLSDNNEKKVNKIINDENFKLTGHVCSLEKNKNHNTEQTTKTTKEKLTQINNKRTTRSSNARPEDLGYLSTESNESRKDESQSDTDDSFYDGASESGAESIATDSFFFDKIRKCAVLKAIKIGNTSNGPQSSDTDSNVSLITVLP